ncbi:MAG: histidinol-phosphatase [Planctomycetota bacterium]|nr:MAG: histidinol-phosphatase [Planctomycetota bacterium]
MSENQEFKKFIEQLADVSEQNILKYMDKDFSVEYKEDKSPVTIVDKSTEEILRKMIEKEFPDHLIIGEEFGGSTDITDEYTWVLDPIDGTKSFIAGIPLFGTLIALLKDGKPFMGCINVPCQKERMIGVIGEETTLNGRVVRAKETGDISNAVLLTTCMNDAIKYFGDTFLSLQSRVAYTRTWGDCYGHLMVACGRADIMIDPELNLWDIAALMPCVVGSGASFYNFDGDCMGLEDQVFSSCKNLKADVLAVLKNQ